MLVPFTKDGAMCDYISSYALAELKKGGPGVIGLTPREVTEFNAVLRYKGFRRGRSAATHYWECVMTGATYPMFAAHMTDTLTRANFQEARGAIVDGKWGVRKQGSNYSIFPITE